MGINEKLSKEKDKVSGMNKEQKWEYFKAYYLAKTICVVIAIILLIWFVNDTILQKKVVSAGCVYNVPVSDDAKEALTIGFLDYYHYDKNKYEAFVSIDNMFEDTEQKMDANAQEMALITQASAGEIHYLILDRNNFDRYASGGIYASLDELFKDGLPEKVKDKVIYADEPESGISYPAAIDLSDTKLFGDSKEALLVFTIGIPDKDYPKKFLDYILNM